jgi:S1-C subfamily serine protease
MNTGYYTGSIARALLCLLSSFLISTVAHTQEKEPVSMGTGFYVSGAGHIVTALHVIRGKSQVLVGPVDRRLWRVATVLKTDEAIDLALLQVKLDRPPLTIAPWSEVPVGLEAVVIGYPMPQPPGSAKKITQGIVNGEGAPGVAAGSAETAYFQLSAEVQKGNSGGPVLSPDGLVIGVVRAKLNALSVAQKTGDFTQNVNYALKSSRLIEFLQMAGVPLVPGRLNLSAQPRPYETFRKTEASIVAVIGRNPGSTTAGRGNALPDVQMIDKAAD